MYWYSRWLARRRWRRRSRRQHSGTLPRGCARPRCNEPATADDAVRDVAAWSDAELAALLPAVSKLPVDQRTRVVARGLLLHTDIVMSHRTPTGYRLESSARSATVFVDGHAVAQGETTYHWRFSRQLLARLPRGEDRTRLARLYYHATGALLQWWAAHTELDAHLAAARTVLDSDAELALYEGTRHQVYAHRRAQVFFAEARRHIDSRVSPRGGIPRDFAPPVYPSITGERIRAEEALRLAVRRAPDLAEARIRLAHVLSDRAEHRDALRQIAEVNLDEQPPLLAFYASVVEGRARRALGQLDEAGAAFTRALSLFPDSQIPRVALSELALVQGSYADARTHLGPLPDTAVDDPWWLLPRLHANLETAMRAFWEAGR